MDLAKPCLDVGIYTNRVDEQRAFWGERIGLPYEELLKAGGGVHQHRYALRGSVFKLNAARGELGDGATSFRRLVISDPALDGDESELLTDPDGTVVERVAVGHEGIEAIGIHWATTDADRLGALLRDGFDATELAPGRWRVGTTVLTLIDEPTMDPTEGMFARGLRYLTVQVRDVRVEHARLLALGWAEGRAPVRLGDVAFISFVRDPDGGWIEVSQRASLTGPLPASG